ncbi:MAG: type 1 glutamine amidotransferase domain-containing protein, partial [Myxococcota bacterium]
MNTKRIFAFLALNTLLTGPSMPALGASSERVLVVVSGHGRAGGKTQPGYDFEEFAKAYAIFRSSKMAIDVASPLGGAVDADEYNPNDPVQRSVIDDPIVSAKLARTLSVGEVDPKRYAAVFVVGGKGAMFDLPQATALHAVIADVYEAGGVVAAVCHGPAALVDVRLSDGEYLVAGKAVNGFTNVEESLFGKKWASKFPFKLEDALKARGGRFESGPLMLAHVTVHDRLITGQNPTSAAGVADAVLRRLGKTPAPRPLDPKEATLKLIARILQDDPGAVDQYQKDPAAFQGPLIAAYGYYYSQVVTDHRSLRHSLSLMEMVPGMMNKKQLRL